MLKTIAILSLYALIQTASADEIGLRVDSLIPQDDNSVIQFPIGGDGYNGKMINAFYDWEPHQNFFLEGAIGYRSYSDIFEYSSAAYELSPGFRVTWHVLVLKLSEGVSWRPEDSFNPATSVGYQPVDFVTHLTIGLRDPKTGVGIYFDRSHYSNGFATGNPSLNYTGFQFSFPIGGNK